MNLHDYIQHIKRARAIARIRRRSERAKVDGRRAALRLHIIYTTDSAAFDRIIEPAR